MTDTMKLWDAVCTTNPDNTKQVNQRGGFTSICAQSQIMEATRQFGPIGVGWGYTASLPIFHDNLVFVQVTLWHGSRENTFGPVTGGEEWKDAKGRIDSDAAKKATTDAVTKLLSQLGFNADVFLGLYDDNKYVAGLRQKFSKTDAPDPESLITDKTRDWLSGQIDAAGVPVGEVCKQFNVTSLKALKFKQVREVTDWLKQRKAA